MCCHKSLSDVIAHGDRILFWSGLQFIGIVKICRTAAEEDV